MRPGPSTGSLRGCLVGGTVGALAIAAHGVAGGGFPDSAESALLLVVSALTGWAAAYGAGSWRGSRAPSAPNAVAVLGPLAIGQLAGHAVLTGLIDHSHTHDPSSTDLPRSYLPTGWMLVAHLIATLGCVALILLAERLYALASSVIRAVSTAGSPPEITDPIRWPDPGLGQYSFPPKGAIGPRAPPVPA
ncbi:hypothetical protein ACQP0C_00380 [Nocardia sp. CA-129566]|uniref:hypothetical protein n=1 Tax=Nocardia sp. CA-129566 TaxID=3239976 RepID=UPI003D96B197